MGLSDIVQVEEDWEVFLGMPQEIRSYFFMEKPPNQHKKGRAKSTSQGPPISSITLPLPFTHRNRCIGNNQMFIRKNMLHDHIVFECRLFLHRLGAWGIRHIFREQNRVANQMAKEGREKGNFCDVSIFEVPLMFMRDYYTTDILGTTAIRKVRNNSSFYASRDVAQNSLFVTTNMLCNLTIGKSLD